MQINVKLGGQPATPAHMGRRIGRAADPYQKQGGRRAGGRPKRTKSGRNRRPFGSARWSCFNRPCSLFMLGELASDRNKLKLQPNFEKGLTADPHPKIVSAHFTCQSTQGQLFARKADQALLSL